MFLVVFYKERRSLVYMIKNQKLLTLLGASILIVTITGVIISNKYVNGNEQWEITDEKEAEKLNQIVTVDYTNIILL